MLVRNGWAAFLAIGIFLSAAVGSAQASPSRLIVGCFSPQNADLIGRLGPQDESVKNAFVIGACLALSPGASPTNVMREQNLWRFQIYGARVPLFAADWGAGFLNDAKDVERSAAFSGYLPISARLLRQGRAFAECYDAYEGFARRWDDFKHRWDAYQAFGGRGIPGTTTKLTVYVADTGPKLMAERDALQREGMGLERRCPNVSAVELDQQFLTFLRTANV